MTLEKGKVISCGVDWITATITPTSEKLVNALEYETRCDYWQRHALAITNEPERKDWSMHGYTGWTVGWLDYGTGTNGSIIRVKSDEAHGHWTAFADTCTNISRLDLEVTVQFTRDLEDLAKDEAIKADMHRQNGGHRFGIRHVRGFGDGDTLYLGSRVSAVFTRLYDKGRESKDASYENAWRYEVEYKEAMPLHIAKGIRDPKCHNSAVAARVFQEYERHGIRCGFEPDKVPSKLVIPAKLGTIEGKLQWLNKSVSPTLKLLAKAGRVQDALKALDIASLHDYIE